MLLLEAAGFLALGFVVGTYGTMVGLGGGFILVPVLIFEHVIPRQAAGTSLAVVLANGISGTYSYLRQKRIDVRTGCIFAAASVPGAIFGAYVDQSIGVRVFSVSLGLFLAVVAARLLFGTAASERSARADKPGAAPSRFGTLATDFVDAAGVRYRYRFNVWLGIALSFVSGLLASLFGVGGGVVQVPAMIYLFGFPAHIATATSSFIIALTSAVGTASHVYYGDVLWKPAILLSLGAILGAPVGARIAKNMLVAPLLRWLALAILLAAFGLIFREP